MSTGPGSWQVVTSNFAGIPRVIGDVNGDGFGDVVHRSQSQTVRTSLGDGTGLFNGPLPSPLTFATPFAALADVDGDGIDDLVSCCYVGAPGAGQFIGRGTPSGAFVPLPLPAGLPLLTGPMRAIDQNGDGNVDIFYPSAGGTRFLLGTGGGGFTPGPILNAVPPLTPANHLGDFNGDGVVDVVFLTGSMPQATGVSVLYGSAGGTWLQATRPFLSRPTVVWNELYVADLDGDGADDVIVTSPQNVAIPPPPFVIYGAAGSLGPDGSIPVAPGVRASTVEIVDYEEDGDLDLLAAGFTPSGSAIRSLLNLRLGSHGGLAGSYPGGCRWSAAANPTLQITGSAVSGQLFSFDVAGAPAGASGLLAVAIAPGRELSPNGCWLAVPTGGAQPPLLIPHGLSGQGAATLPFVIPPTSGLVGARLYLQSFALEPSLFGGFAASAGLMVVIG